MKSLHTISLIITGFFITTGNSFSQSQAAEDPLLKDRIATVDGHKMHYQKGGKGSYTVVFENGHGETVTSWDAVYSKIASFSKVFRYDRMGYGSSQETDAPRTFKQIATELHSLLKASNTPPPYILVAHSLGGAIVRAFAFLYKNETAGIVMLDPYTEFINEGLSGDLKESYLKTGDSVMQNFPPSQLAEWKYTKEEYRDGGSEIKSFGDFPDLPSALLVAGKSRFLNWEKNLVAFYEAKMRDLPDSRLIVLPQSGHDVVDYAPFLVVECVHNIVYRNIFSELVRSLEKRGVDSCIALFKKMKAMNSQEFMWEEMMNTFGYVALDKKDTKGAIRLFTVNTSMFPASANAYDSLGEAYMDDGNKTAAIANYKKSLLLNPANTNAKHKLDKLK